jgi:Family of unknown function (DUF6444)
LNVGVSELPDLNRLTPAEKDALILALWAQVQALEAKLGLPPKTPDNSSVPPSRGHKANRPQMQKVFQNSTVVLHVVRKSRGAGVVREVLDGHRPALWVSDLYSAQQGHAKPGRSAWRTSCATAPTPSRPGT